MQLGDDLSVLEISSHTEPEMAVTAVAPPEEAAHEGGDDNGGGGDEMIGMDVDANSVEGNEGSNKMSFGGNRWPRQETLALLKIRSDMDAVFRDSSLKGPLWEEVSRKLAGFGYQRSAKKCKEKFENVYKYNKRTKENKSGKSQGKTYKFFDQLQALENQFTVTVSYPPKPQPTTLATTTNTLTLPTRPSDHGNKGISYVTPFPSTNPILISPPPQTNTTTTTTTTSTNNPRDPSPPQTNNNNNNNVPHSFPNMNTPFSTTTTSTSSSTASDEDLEERYRRKRKWKDYFRRLTRKVLLKQEEMQNKFLEAMDKRERERVAQQDNWRIQEMARINREHEILVQERSTAAAKDAAVIALLQKLYGQQNPTQQVVEVEPPPQQKPTIPQPQPPISMQNNNFQIKKMNNGHSATSTTIATTAAATTTASPVSSSSSSRWPKAEVHALIRLRTSLDPKYQENGPKAPLWEDISIAMQRLGYNRSSKRCKEKWENINKYFKKVRESNKERREDSKTCPYFHELEALYKEKDKSQNPFGMFQNMKPNEMMMMEPLMVQPEQQWRPPPQSLDEEGIAKENASEEYQEKEEKGEEEEEQNGGDDDDDDVEEDGDSVEDEGANPCEIATNN